MICWGRDGAFWVEGGGQAGCSSWLMTWRVCWCCTDMVGMVCLNLELVLQGAHPSSPAPLVTLCPQEQLYSFVTLADDQNTKGKGVVVLDA